MTVVYRHIRKDKNEPFYIGIGSVRRANSKSERNSIWNRIVNKTEYEVEILMEFKDRRDAMEKEMEFISLYGRINNGTGCLSNMTDGGEGAVGTIFSSERKRKLSKRYSGAGNPTATKVYCGYLDEYFETISECAERLSVSQPYLSRMINGERFNKFKIEAI